MFGLGVGVGVVEVNGNKVVNVGWFNGWILKTH